MDEEKTPIKNKKKENLKTPEEVPVYSKEILLTIRNEEIEKNPVINGGRFGFKHINEV